MEKLTLDKFNINTHKIFTTIIISNSVKPNTHFSTEHANR